MVAAVERADLIAVLAADPVAAAVGVHHHLLEVLDADAVMERSPLDGFPHSKPAAMRRSKRI